MDVLPLEDGGLRFLEMPKAFYEQLMRLPQSVDPDGDPLIAQRLAPHPLDDAEEASERESAEEDWEAYVRPELELAHDQALHSVMEDLEAARVDDSEDDPHYRLEIPTNHVASWFQILNRARIVLAIRHRLPFSDYLTEEGEDSEEKISLQRLFAAHLSDNYAGILEILVHQMSGELD